jgi:hypothetical protein
MENQNPQKSGSGMIRLTLIIINIIFLKLGYIVDKNWYSGLVVSLPLLIVAILISREKKCRHATIKIVDNEKNKK